MTFRTRLLLAFLFAVVLAAGLATWIVSTATRRAFERLEEQRVAALVEQFQREFNRRGAELARRVEGIAGAESTLNIAIALSAPAPDYSLFVNEAQALAAAHGLDFLELVAGGGEIVSSAQWPARFGYIEEWLARPAQWNGTRPFLAREQLPERTALALVCVRTVVAGDKPLYVVGGRELDRDFLQSLPLPAGMRALLYRDLEPGFSAQALTGSSGPVRRPDRLRPLIERVRANRQRASMTVQWFDDRASAETFHAIPLPGRDDSLLGVLLVGSSRREQAELEALLLRLGLLIGGAGIVLGLVFSWWATARVTRPVQALAAGAREVAQGNWKAHVPVDSDDEIGQLASAFNQMTRQLIEQRDRLLQAERVAAWRELARRLAHELKNPLFPLQITVENLQRARERHPEQFDEVFRESTATLLAELSNLKGIIGSFSDFARMPPPEREPVRLNDLVAGALKLFQAQIRDSEIELRMELDPRAGVVEADAAQISRAVQNLALNAIDAMPGGGILTVRTNRTARGARLEIADTGRGLTREECERLFTPYYTTKTHGTGLGLAIVQSVVSDHGGRIAVSSQPGQGTTFSIDLE